MAKSSVFQAEDHGFESRTRRHSRRKLLGPTVLWVVILRDAQNLQLLLLGRHFQSHEHRPQGKVRPRHKPARGRVHIGTRFLNGITQVGFLPG